MPLDTDSEYCSSARVPICTGLGNVIDHVSVKENLENMLQFPQCHFKLYIFVRSLCLLLFTGLLLRPTGPLPQGTLELGGRVKMIRLDGTIDSGATHCYILKSKCCAWDRYCNDTYFCGP